MTNHHLPPPAILFTLRYRMRPVAACLLAAALGACGGGADMDSEPPAAKAQANSLPSTVQFTGCVVDQYFVPNEGVAVRALGDDGRLLGSVRSGPTGEFQLRLPADARVAVQVDVDDGESMAVRTSKGDEQVPRCLVSRAG